MGDGSIGVWATNRDPEVTDSTGTIYAVGGFAHQFSDWGEGEKTKAELRVTDTGAKAATKCAQG